MPATTKQSNTVVYLIIGFSVFIILIVISWFLTTRELEAFVKINETILSTGEKMEAINSLVEIARTRTRLSHEMLMAEDVFERDERVMEIDALAGEFILTRRILLAMDLEDDDREILDSLLPIYPVAVSGLEKVAQLALLDTEEATEQAREIIVREVVPAQGKIIDGFNLLMRNMDNKLAEESRAGAENYKNNEQLRLMLMLLVIIISVITIGVVVQNVLKIEHQLRDLSLNYLEEKEHAEQANLSMSHFLAAASHDLRQPLHALAFLFDALKSSSSDDERKKLFPKIDLSINALTSLFNALLDISKLDADAVETYLEHFQIFDVLHTPLEEFSTEAKQKGIRLRVHCRECIVYSDKILLERIARNLISNAIRYTDSGGILISCRQRDNHILFQVWDSGIGIDEAHHEKIFKEFHQVDNPHRDRKKGLGLGLSIVKRMCDLLGYQLHLRSVKGRGTVVCLLIPSGDISDLQSEEHPVSNTPWSINGLEVLLIEDDAEVLDATTILLQNWGCNVISASSLMVATNKLDWSSNPPQLILSDLRLPNDTNGIDAINSIRQKLGLDVPAILITGDTEPARIQMAKESGYKLLHKPLKPATVRAAIHQLLD
jgi:signal transduction histidine kinase